VTDEEADSRLWAAATTAWAKTACPEDLWEETEDKMLLPASADSRALVLLVAAHAGNTRLIDNLQVQLHGSDLPLQPVCPPRRLL
jgi:pantothenate synthetase